MSATSKIDWRVLADEWEQFIGYVDEEYVANDRYIRQEVESAMEEFIDRDDFAELEERIDRLVRAAGRRPRDVSENKMVSTDTIAEGEKTRVTIHIFTDIRKQFTIQAKKQSDYSLGVVFSLALREYRQGGRAARLEDKLDRVIDDAEGLLSELSDGSTLSTVEKRTIEFCHLLRRRGFTSGITREELWEIIGEQFTSESTIDQYEELVTDRMGFSEHPKNPSLYVRTEDADQQRTEAAEAEAEAVWENYDQTTPARTNGGSECG